MAKKKSSDGERLRLHSIACRVQEGLKELGFQRIVEARQEDLKNRMLGLDIGDVTGLISIQVELKMLKQYYFDLSRCFLPYKIKQPDADEK